MDKILEFKATPDKCLFNSDSYKIYGAFVNSMQYPNVKIGKYGNATIKGDIQDLNIGTEYEIKATEKQDKYGYSYEILNIKREKPNTIESSRLFLYEILTINQADVLLSIYPDIIDRIIKNKLDDIDLNKTKGIKEYTFEVIKKKVIENFKLAELVDEFQGVFNITIIKKLYQSYPSIEKIREVLHENPYMCLCKLNGVGFKTADDLLLKIDKVSKKNIQEGKKPILFFNFDLRTSYQRMKACADFVLSENENSGNTYMSIKMFQKECITLAKDAIDNLAKVIKCSDDIYFDKERLRIARTNTYETEKYIANRIKDGLKSNILWNYDIEKYRNVDGSNLIDSQMLTMEYICKNNIVVLRGYAGSGKSFSTKALINLLKDNNKRFLILAPTGRASKVIAGYTKCSAMTIHRGLAYIPFDEWGKNKDNPITEEIVIVDETSMTDIFLFKRLLEAIDFTKTKLLLIGDDAQIPSVGCGNLLYDLLNSKIIPTVSLDKIFRYGTGGLSTVATDIRESKVYLDKEKQGVQQFGEDKSYTYMPVIQDRAIDYITSLYKKLIEQGYKTEDILVLSSQNKGNYGTIGLNNSIQSIINPKSNKYLKFGDSEYRIGDRVIQCVNDYKAMLYNDGNYSDEVTTFISNGEIGNIIDVQYNGIVVDYDGVIIFCPKTSMQNIKLGYAISMHKSQGGQAKVIILFTPKAHTFMLNSNLLYVGATRAKEKCYHIGETDTINKAIKKKENFDRKTFLGDLLVS